MNRVNMTEANQNFSKIAKMVETDGVAIIEKNGSDRYVVMTSGEYRRLLGDVFWVEMSPTQIVKFERLQDLVTAQEVEVIGKDKYKYTICKMPANSMNVEFDGENVTMEFHKELLKAISMREALTLYRTVEVDISKKAISDLSEDKSKKDALIDAITVRDLIEEQKEAKSMSYLNGNLEIITVGDEKCAR